MTIPYTGSSVVAQAPSTPGVDPDDRSMVFQTLKMRKEGGVLFVAIAAPPMNLLGPELVRDLVALIQRAEADDAIHVLVFKSADPDYFISHVDVIKIKEYRQEAAKLTGEASIALLFRHLSASRLVTIAQIEGRVRGGWDATCDLPRESRRFSVSRNRDSGRSPVEAPSSTSRASWAAPGHWRSC